MQCVYPIHCHRGNGIVPVTVKFLKNVDKSIIWLGADYIIKTKHSTTMVIYRGTDCSWKMNSNVYVQYTHTTSNTCQWYGIYL